MVIKFLIRYFYIIWINIFTELLVTNSVVGEGASILASEQENYDINLSEGRGSEPNETFCNIVIVTLVSNFNSHSVILIWLILHFFS